ncbi:Hypothetical protein (Fragment) [Durusdinium trenchii]|uniref:Uncharacterized protein n=1 Tax=Durusdinium trenchii TaxID=1381693 RepID=A0ABP0PD98_9DINO
MPIRMALNLSTALAMNRSLVELTMTVDSTTVLCLQGLRQNTALRHLSLNAVDWGSAGELGVALATVLSQNASLESLCLKTDGTNFSDKTGTVLAQALTQNTSLASLHISTEDTSVGDETGIALAEALWLNDVLRHFLWAAGRTRLTDLTGRTLAQAAQQNCNLQSFQFSAVGTELSDETGMAMAAVLENFALHSFSFEASETQVGDISGIAFAKSLHSSASLRRFSFVGNFCNVSEETCRAMGEAVGSTCLTAFEFSALHLFVSERTSICLRNALQRNNSLESIKFQTCQLDGDRAYTAVQEAVGKAIFKRGQRRCEHQPGCPCFQLSSDMPSKDLETSCLSCSDWGSAIVIEKESGEDAAFRSGKLSYADSLSETDIGDGEAEAITTVSSTDTPIWESMQGV